MSLKFTNSARIETPSSSFLTGSTKLGFSVRLKFDAVVGPPPEGWTGSLISGTTGVWCRFYQRAYPGATECRLVLGVKDAPVGDGLYAIFGVPIGVVSHLALVFDAADPTRRFISVNGFKTMLPATEFATTPAGTGKLEFKGDASYFLEDAFWIDDAAPTDAELLQLRDGDLAAVDSITARGGEVAHFPFSGEPGPAAGTPGLSTTIGPALSFATPSGSAPVEYVAGMPFVELAGFGEPAVMSAGRMIVVPVQTMIDGAAAPAIAKQYDQTKTPTFRINGGPPLAPKAVLGTDGWHEGLLCALPDGVEVAKTDALTWSAPNGLVVTTMGTTGEVVDAPVRNRVGRTSFDRPEEAEPFRLGVNMTRPGPTYYASERMARNLRLAMGDGNKGLLEDGWRPDGTRSKGRGGCIIHDAPISSLWDGVGHPIPLGLWYVAWLDKGAAGLDGEVPCEIVIYGPNDYNEFNLIEEYSRDEVQSDGSVKRVRVYECVLERRPMALAQAIDADQTTIAVDSIWTGSFPNAEGVNLRLDLDGETIVATGADRASTPPRLLNCVRGVEGTAKAHALGDPGTIGSTSVGGYAFLNINAIPSNGTIRYSDLTILAPEEWQPPVPASPAPWVSVGPLEMSKEFLRWTAGGLGAVRFMDSSYGDAFSMQTITEADQLRNLDDQTWTMPKVPFPIPRLASAKRYDPDSSSWAYACHPGQGHQTYSVNLLESLPAEPAGTRRTIAVALDAANPIMRGTRLIAGGERMRVVSGSGSSWLVERGTDGTTPEAVSAGAIQAGWRLPFPTAATPANMHKMSVVEFKTVEPHGLMSLHSFAVSPTADANPLSRRSLKLTDAVNATTLTIPVAADAPEDWDYIHPGLTLVMGGESLEITAVDRASGLLTVKERPAGQAQAADLAIATRSNGGLYESADGTTRRWGPLFGWGYNFIVNGPDTIVLVRDGFEADEKYLVGEQVSDPPTPFNQSVPGSCFPIEFSAKCADHAKGWFWLNLPNRASDDLVIEVARRLRDNFPAGRKVIVETANEVWNFAFPYWGPYSEVARLSGIANAQEAWVVDSARRCDLVRSVFAETGRESEVLHCLPWQSGGIGTVLKAARDHGVDVDVTGCAPYFSPRSSPGYIDLLNQEGDAAACDMWTFALACDLYTNTMPEKLRRDAAAVDAHVSLTGRPLFQLHYEGGLDTTIPPNPGADQVNPAVTQSVARNRDIRSHPNFYFSELDHANLIARTSLGLTLFNNAQPEWRNSNAAPQDALWGMATHWMQKPGYGDGRDGGADNRLNLHRRGVAESAGPTTSRNGTKESVRWQAAIDHNQVFFGGKGPECPCGEGGSDEQGGRPTPRLAIGGDYSCSKRSRRGKTRTKASRCNLGMR